QSDFADTVLNTLEKSGLGAEYLELELTESGLLTDVEANIATFNRLRDKGIQLALDDFGTGYSSLSYICKLPIDVIKIDKEFIQQISLDRQNRSVV
ncbi:MAG: EAL domain-containing protein, partial [Gammaproteobacteria bacterium]|nr:EAL domain-containing protein [Gammaproteobacteria bacterium]NIR96339.1 EAL domain-containing protein [Gammaproteobacteria bacterium]NIW45870.1 EAL domain-containing protein [Gammaproteobacteria bacterium]NIW97579.1 EAL domain-containing protein [Phycisphaerae bacterium]